MKIKVRLECEAVPDAMNLNFECDEHSKAGICLMRAMIVAVKASSEFCSHGMDENRREILNNAFETLLGEGGENLEA